MERASLTVIVPIFNQLHFFEKREGAFFVDQNTFSLIYHLEKRRAERKWPPAFTFLLQLVEEEVDGVNLENAN